jgi:glucose/arabinose dehydrogenase
MEVSMNRYKRRMVLASGCLSILSLLGANPALAIGTERIATGLNRPVFVTAPDGDERLFIVEQRGVIKILKEGVVQTPPFLDIDHKVPDITGNDERGLLGLAFHPDFAANREFFINYTNLQSDTVIARYIVSATKPDSALLDSEEIVLLIDQPFQNHNGGTLLFGPNDGYLYIGMGDGGSAEDPGNRAQDDFTLLGKMLRIDVDGGSPYAIPPDNPFVEEPPLDEIWAKGLRNPYRWSFDRLTGDLYVADVGQYAWEEIDFDSADSPGGRNYGWRRMEGNHCFNPPSDCNDGTLVLPIHEYSHGGSQHSPVPRNLLLRRLVQRPDLVLPI